MTEKLPVGQVVAIKPDGFGDFLYNGAVITGHASCEGHALGYLTEPSIAELLPYLPYIEDPENWCWVRCELFIEPDPDTINERLTEKLTEIQHYAKTSDSIE